MAQKATCTPATTCRPRPGATVSAAPRGGIYYQVTGDAELAVGRTLFAGRKHKSATERQVANSAHQVNMLARQFLCIRAADDAGIRGVIMDWVIQRVG